MKKVLLVGSLLVSGLVVFGKSVLKKYETGIKQLKFNINNIKNIKISNSTLAANVQLNITNPTSLDFTTNTNGLVKLERLDFYNKNTFIGIAKPNISSISIPKNSTTISPYIPVTIPLTWQTFGAALQIVNNSQNIVVKPVIEVFNKTYIL